MAAHAEQLAEHGGGEGVRDAGAIDSAMMRPRNLALYEEPDAAALAAAYAFGVARNHPFVDGNKRTAAVVSETFLVLNGHVLGATDAELVVAILALAAVMCARELSQAARRASGHRIVEAAMASANIETIRGRIRLSSASRPPSGPLGEQLAGRTVVIIYVMLAAGRAPESRKPP